MGSSVGPGAGGPFSAPEVIAAPAGAYADVGLADATMNGAGDVLVAWEAFSGDKQMGGVRDTLRVHRPCEPCAGGRHRLHRFRPAHERNGAESLEVLIGDGNLNNNNPLTTNNLSAADPSPRSANTGAVEWDLQPAPLAFGSNKANGAVAAWVDADNAMRAALRPTGSNLFGTTQTLVSGDGCQVTQPLGDITPCRWATSAAVDPQATRWCFSSMPPAAAEEPKLKLLARTTN